jgi:hypothetical protein
MCSSQRLPSSEAAEGNSSDERAASEPPAGERSDTAPPETVSLQIHNQCPRTVKLFLGRDPQHGSGTSTSMSSNEVRNFPMSQGEMLWIVDDSDKPLSSTTASGGPFVEMAILESCTGFGPY